MTLTLFLPLLAQTPDLDNSGLSLGWLFTKTIIAMILILVLAFTFIRYFMPRFLKVKSSPNSQIKILDRVGLEAKKGLYLIQVGQKIALIGTSEHNIEKVMELDKKDLNNEEGT